MDDLFMKYYEEGLGFKFIKTDHSFLAYKINDEECYIAKVFVEKEKRKSGVLKSMVDQVSAIAKENNCKYMSAAIDVPEANTALIVALSLGFEIQQKTVLVAKSLGER